MESSTLYLCEVVLGLCVFSLAVIRTGGISFIFRFFFKLIRFRFNDKKFEDNNNSVFDLQLYRFISGINVETHDDAYFIQDKIKQGKLKGISFFGAGFFGPVLRGKANKTDFAVVGIIAIACAFLIVITLNASASFKNGYATYRFEDGRYMFINTERILNPYSKKEINCHDPLMVRGGGKNYNDVCDYLVNQTPQKKQKILEGIKYDQKQKKSFVTMAATFMILLGLLIIGFCNYIVSSKKLIELKESEAAVT